LVLPVAINHMTVARKSLRELIDISVALGCVGVELRNDLDIALFDGMEPEEARQLLEQSGLQLLALAEVKMFNDWSDAKATEAAALIDLAKRAGAKAISLIPRNDNMGLGNGERQANLRLALRELQPMLAEAGLVGLVEPLGFETCALRQKSEAVDAIEALGAAGTFQLVHDTFHHHLAGGGPIFAQHTGIVHVSGVVDTALATNEMGDEHRILVDAHDRLGNVTQLRSLIAEGYEGPVSFEAFAPQVHDLREPQQEIEQSIGFIRSGLAPLAA
jgi:2-keto-myo-inositol isomerase